MSTKELKSFKLPTYNELVNTEVVNSKENEFQVFLNQNPPDKWIKTNSLANNSQYIPIDKVEYLLTRLFLKWYVEVIDYKIIANSVSVQIRLFYQSPLTGEMLHQDGLGAAPMQTDKDKGAIDFNYIKNAAVQMALPAAESYAIKDAAEKIGRIFGKDLNRKDLMNYESLTGRYAVSKITEADITTISDQLEHLHDLEEINMYWKQLDDEATKDSRVIQLFNTKITNTNARPTGARARS